MYYYKKYGPASEKKSRGFKSIDDVRASAVVFSKISTRSVTILRGNTPIGYVEITGRGIPSYFGYGELCRKCAEKEDMEIRGVKY